MMMSLAARRDMSAVGQQRDPIASPAGRCASGGDGNGERGIADVGIEPTTFRL